MKKGLEQGEKMGSDQGMEVPRLLVRELRGAEHREMRLGAGMACRAPSRLGVVSFWNRISPQEGFRRMPCLGRMHLVCRTPT